MINLLDRKPKILVIGDIILDKYKWGSCEKISPEAPVQVINISDETDTLGGAGNVISNLISLGAEADILSVLGKCSISKLIRKKLKDSIISTDFLIEEPKRLSSVKTRIIASQQQVVRYDRETIDGINTQSENKLFSKFAEIIKKYDIVLLSDYGKGVLTKKLTQNIIKLSNQKNIKVIVDPKGQDYSKYKNAYLLTPNKNEASIASKIKIHDKKTLESAISFLKETLNLKTSLITLSEDGIATFDNQKLNIYPAFVRKVYDVTGAGDTVLASLGFSLASGNSLSSSVRFANLAAGVVVGKIGCASASFDEIVEYESSHHKSSSELRIKSIETLKSILFRHKSENKKIVFTNGCFDLLHPGHVKYLEEAKSYGDILIVGLNSDNSVKKIKGPKRPINAENDRALVLSGLESVDYVTIFDEDTPLNLIKTLKPDILVKGGDYHNQKIVGSSEVKEIKILSYTENKSTTSLIEKILKNGN